ncbi:hypothetical protein [Marinoscillum luteum]|uniref:DUF4149 domain-containing protein n=1 Tax=Marinoscillum luteum TaxID=861051 RepID=A0ABW7NDA7_9BACT
MSTTVKHPVTVASVFLWIGFVCAISFMEAWLKFQAEGVTLVIGLSIGRLVFDALNKIEWVFALSVIISIFWSKDQLFQKINTPYFIVLILLISQTFRLLPALDIRAQMLIDGKEVGASNTHFYYVGMEVVKVVCLFIFGIKLFKSTP